MQSEIQSETFRQSNLPLGIMLMVATAVVFAIQDGISRYLVASYPMPMVVMIRYWFFAAFVLALTARQKGGLRLAARSAYPGTQIFRGICLALQICCMVYGFSKLGLVESHAVFAAYPLLVAALSGPILGEIVGWRRWIAILIGFAGVLVILKPGFGVFSPYALIPFFAASFAALYGLLTRMVSQKDAASVSFFWTGCGGAATMCLIGPWFWTPMQGGDWGWMGLLCLTGALGHFILIKCYEVAEASAVQPFAFLQMLFAAIVGIVIFDESVSVNILLGAMMIVGAGLFVLWRARLHEQK